MTRGGHVPQSRVVLLAERSALHEHAPIGSDDPDVRGAMPVAVTMDLRFALLRAGGTDCDETARPFRSALFHRARSGADEHRAPAAKTSDISAAAIGATAPLSRK